MPLYKADILIPNKVKDAYPIDITAYTSSKDISEATTKFAKYATSKKGIVEVIALMDDKSVIL